MGEIELFQQENSELKAVVVKLLERIDGLLARIKKGCVEFLL